MISLRARNRLNAMRLTQRTALSMFVDRGFDAVKVEEIAAEVGIGASTIYRHFATKEAIVLWDEHDASLEAALVEELGRQPPLAAMRTVFSEELGQRYESDLEFQLKRVKYIYATESLHAAAVEADFKDRAELTEAVEQVLSTEHRDAAGLLAGAALLALDAALERWQRLDAKRSLGELITESFDQLAGLDSMT